MFKAKLEAEASSSWENAWFEFFVHMVEIEVVSWEK